jgi:hypothetical protein
MFDVAKIDGSLAMTVMVDNAETFRNGLPSML